MTEFRPADIGRKLEECLRQFESVISRNEPILVEVRQKLHQNLDDFYLRGFLSVVFVGEYNAGKSTIISALTNRRDVEISADIATDRTAFYPWHGIRLIDTPGLYTERKDHDDITYEAIRQADLLVFCLTHALFDAITVENFKRLAYEQRYRRKMMLVINKMSAEAGDEEEKIHNYKKSIAEALKPHDPEEFPTCFIDARDYLNGIDEHDEELKNLSRFDAFIQALNDFVQAKRTLAKLDTPIHILLGHLNEASSILAQSPEADSTYLELLNRLSKTVERERARLQTRIRGIAMHLSSKVADEGVALAQQVGQVRMQQDFEDLCRKVQDRIQSLSEQAASEMEQAINAAIGSLREQISEVLNSPLAQSFMVHLEASDSIDVGPFVWDDSVKRLKAEAGKIAEIARQVALKIGGQATKEISGIPGSVARQSGTFFIRATEAAGSPLHRTIYEAGKFFGFEFKPWQAVNLAKNIGNVMKVVGPLLAVVSVILDSVDAYQEAQNERKLAQCRQEIDSKFLAIAQDFEAQFEKKRTELEKELYGSVERKIHEARALKEEEIAESYREVQEILNIRGKLEGLFDEIFKAI